MNKPPWLMDTLINGGFVERLGNKLESSLELVLTNSQPAAGPQSIPTDNSGNFNVPKLVQRVAESGAYGKNQRELIRKQKLVGSEQ